jgi:SAM-dependent methyltransferase
LESGKYKRISIKCICGQSKDEDQIKISEKDRYGIPSNFVLCKKCGIIFQNNPLSKPSLKEFYKYEYNTLYKGKIANLDKLFNKALTRGKRFKHLLKKVNIIDKIDSVFETGCATGANLYPFYLENKVVHGFDYDENLLTYGRNKGLNLFNIDDLENNSKKNYDLIISSHVLEHVLDPLDFLNSQIKHLKSGKFFLLEVPGPFSFHKNNNKIIDNLVNAHIYYFHEKFLINIASKLGLIPIYSDQLCTFLFQKIKENNFHQNIANDFKGELWAKRMEKYLNLLFFKERIGLIKLNNKFDKLIIFLRSWLKNILIKINLFKN